MVTHITRDELGKLKVKGLFAELPELRKPGTKKKKTGAESAIVSACIKWLYWHGCFVWRHNTGMLRDAENRPIRFGLKGSADIIGMTPKGRFLAVECKAGKKDLTEDQLGFKSKVLSRGGLYLLARGTDDLEQNKREIIL